MAAMDLQMRPLVWKALAGSADVLVKAGGMDEAAQKRDQARAVIDEIAREFKDEKLRDTYLASAEEKLKMN